MGVACCRPKEQQKFMEQNTPSKKNVQTGQMTQPVTDMNKQIAPQEKPFDLSFVTSDSPQIPPQFQERFKAMTDEMTKEIEADWKEEENTPVFQFWKKDLHSWKAFKCRFVIQDKTPQQVAAWVVDPNKQKGWKDNLKFQEVIQTLNPQVKVIHESLKGLGPVSERQFVFLQVFSKLQNGFQIFETSVNHEKIPETSDPVRGEVFWRLLKFEQEGKNTILHFFGCVHPKGSIFSMMSGKMVDKVKGQAHSLQDLMIKGSQEAPATAVQESRPEEKKSEEVKTELPKPEEQKDRPFSNVPQEFQERLQNMNTQCEQEIAANNWSQEENKPDFKFWKKDLHSWKAFKCQIIIPNKKVEEVVSWFSDVEKQLKWRDTLKTQQLLEQCNPQVKVILELLKGMGPVSEREFVYLSVQLPNANGQTIFETSVEHKSKPAANDPVRGEVFWRLLTLTPQGSNTVIDYVGCVHPRGSIFSFMSGKFTDKIKGQITTLKELLSK